LGNAIHFPTLLLMGGLMILSARVRVAGVYEVAAAWIARQAGQPRRLLALTIAIGGILSAVLVNDIVVFAMTPLLCAGIAARKLDPRPLLFTTSLPREISALLIAACLLISRTVPSRQLLDEIDLPPLILFAALFVVNGAFGRTGLAEQALQALSSHGLLPDRASLLMPLSLLLSNTIGNVPAVVMILQVWHGIPEGTLVGLAILSTLSGNLLLVGSLANLIVAERAALAGVQLLFRDHVKAGVPITLVSLLFAELWLWTMGLMRL
jgi:Na+/H+ antiporter NhaD/arsenite permease-like protein